MAFPWTALATIAAPLIYQLLFPGSSEAGRTQTTEVEQSPRAPFDPGWGALSPALLGSLSENLMRKSGAGMPGGVGLNQDMYKDILELLRLSWPDIMGGMKEGYDQDKRQPPSQITPGGLGR